MDKKELTKAIEAVLFAGGEPISIDRICTVFELREKEAKKVMDEVIGHIEKADLGFLVVRLDDSYQLVSKTEYAQYIKTAFEIKRRTPLSSAAFEVLAVIAYNQPVTRAFIEQVRGVDCSAVVSTLIEKDLVEERGRLELPGRPLLYGTTKNFLRCFSLSSLEDLPPLPDKTPTINDYAEQLEVAEVVTDNQE